MFQNFHSFTEDLNPPKQKRRKIKVAVPKIKKYPGAPHSYGRPIKDTSIYYHYFSSLYDTPVMDALDLRIREMEEWTIALIDDGYDESPRPSP